MDRDRPSPPVPELLLRERREHAPLVFSGSTNSPPLQRLQRPNHPKPPPTPPPTSSAQNAAPHSAATSPPRHLHGPVAPSWAIIENTILVNSTSPRASLQLSEPPRFSDLLVPAHHINPLPRIDSDPPAATASSSSSSRTAPPRPPSSPSSAPPGKARWSASTSTPTSRVSSATPSAARCSASRTSTAPRRFTPDTRNASSPNPRAGAGRLTGTPSLSSAWTAKGRGAEIRDAALLLAHRRGVGVWDKLVGLPSPLPRPRRIHLDHEVLAFAGRLWWVDLTWGAVSTDPFSDRPELRFVELPWFSVCPVAGTTKITAQGMYRRMGVSEGRIRYAEVSEKEPFVLSSYALDDDGDGWTLEHQVALGPILADSGTGTQEGTPRTGVIDPLNAHIMYVIYGNLALALDMDKGKVLSSSLMAGVRGGPAAFFSAFLKACVLPPWLGTTRIPSAGKTLSDVLVRVDKDKKN